MAKESEAQPLEGRIAFAVLSVVCAVLSEIKRASGAETSTRRLISLLARRPAVLELRFDLAPVSVQIQALAMHGTVLELADVHVPCWSRGWK